MKGRRKGRNDEESKERGDEGKGKNGII